MGVDLRHGGNRDAVASRLNCAPSQLLDASASLVPWSPRFPRIGLSAWRDYPDRSQALLRELIGVLHHVDPSFVLPGNGAAELFTWAARDAVEQGSSVLTAPGFADYGRALRCWSGGYRQQQLPLLWEEGFPQPFPDAGEGSVMWICNPHNPTGQLWSRASLQPLLERYKLVICDEAFLPLVPSGEQQSLIPLVAEHSNLVVIRSLTKLFGIAGLRLGYAIAEPQRLERWSQWRDPWPVNGLAAAAGERLMADASWSQKVQAWVAKERPWLADQLVRRGWQVSPSSCNFLLVQRGHQLESWRQQLEQQHRILVRDCRSFTGLDESWWRLALLDRRRNRRLLRALDQVQATDRA